MISGEVFIKIQEDKRKNYVYASKRNYFEKQILHCI